MRLLGLELKRVLKTRMTWILLVLALFCSVAFAYIPTTFVYYEEEDGTQLRGIQAIQKYKEIRKDIYGEVTDAKIKLALEQVQKALKDTGSSGVYELPEDVYMKQYLPVSPLIHGVLEAYADPDTGMAADLLNLQPEKMDDFYNACSGRLTSLMKLEQPKNPSAWEVAEKRFKDIPKPFNYFPGITSDAMDYETLLIFIILICCVLIVAPIFASDYQTEADAILRCTKKGRTRLAVTKIVSAWLICCALFIICLGLWTILTDCLFGWNSRNTSAQILFSITSLIPWNLGQLQGYVALVALLSLATAISCVLFLSAKCKNQIAVIALAMFGCIIPIFLSDALPTAIGTLFHCIWPTGGIGLQNGILYDFINYDFLKIGRICMWVPEVIIGAMIIEIPIFIWLAVRSYNRHLLK